MPSVPSIEAEIRRLRRDVDRLTSVGTTHKFRRDISMAGNIVRDCGLAIKDTDAVCLKQLTDDIADATAPGETEFLFDGSRLLEVNNEELGDILVNNQWADNWYGCDANINLEFGGSNADLSGVAALNLIRMNADGTALEDAGVSAGGLTNALLDGSNHTDTVAQAPNKGSLIAGNSTLPNAEWDELAVGTDGLYLVADSTEPVGMKWQAVAPRDAEYLCLSTNSDLTAERQLVLGNGIQATDGGANGNYTMSLDIAANSGLVFTGIELSMDLSASAITGTLGVSDGGTGADLSATGGTGPDQYVKQTSVGGAFSVSTLNIIDDTTPVLGGALDAGNFNITNVNGLTVGGTATFNGSVNFNGGTVAFDGATVEFYDAPYLDFAGTNRILFVDASSNVASNANLTWDGTTATVTGNLTVAGDNDVTFNGNTDDLTWDGSAGRLGLGIATPSVQLECTQDVKIDGFTGMGTSPGNPRLSVTNNPTNGFAQTMGIQVTANPTPSAASANPHVAFEVFSQTANTNFTGALTGLEFDMSHSQAAAIGLYKGVLTTLGIGSSGTSSGINGMDTTINWSTSGAAGLFGTACALYKFAFTNAGTGDPGSGLLYHSTCLLAQVVAATGTRTVTRFDLIDCSLGSFNGKTATTFTELNGVNISGTIGATGPTLTEWNQLRIREPQRSAGGSEAYYAIRQQDSNGYTENRLESLTAIGDDATPDTTLHLYNDPALTWEESSSTPSNPTSGSQMRVYMRGDNFVIQYNDGGTVRYKYLDLTGTGVTWTHSTTAPT